jgi:NAD+ synthase|tara:strand:+ start:6244 stop:6993 length:750 start_codon:yes stop_codon:yes gene_type:complete
MNKHIKQITNWLTSYSESSKINSFIIGVSGGIDSALTSTLCAETGINTIVVSMPIHQHESQVERANDHIIWLKNKYDNVSSITVPLTHVYDSFAMLFADNENKLALANSRARLRMTTLYQIAQMNNGLVVGTGNKVEDFGVGFYTKYGDGGVDISPIADLMKSEVRSAAKDLGVIDDIIKAKPTDGLWGDDRTDEDQLGATYDELEWAMGYEEGFTLTERQQEVLDIYNKFNKQNQHKMHPIPVCNING